jgi:hypothetical protein
MVKCTKANGKVVSSMATEPTNGQMNPYMKANFCKAKSTVRESTKRQMGESSRVFGKMVSETAKAASPREVNPCQASGQMTNSFVNDYYYSL